MDEEALEPDELRRAIAEVSLRLVGGRNTARVALHHLSQRISFLKLICLTTDEDKEMLSVLSRKMYGFLDGLLLPNEQLAAWVQEYNDDKSSKMQKEAARAAAGRAAKERMPGREAPSSPYRAPPARTTPPAGGRGKGGGRGGRGERAAGRK